MSFTRGSISVAAALAAGAGLASAQEYDLYIVDALSTFGIPESYLSDPHGAPKAYRPHES